MRPISASLLLMLATFVACALVAEGVLRVWFGPPVHFVYPQPAYVPDERVGHWMQPGQRGFNHDRPLAVNSVGIRGPDRTRRPAPTVQRVLALGDSQTFGNGLAADETWPAQLERALAREAGSGFEVLNAGVSGTDTWHHERILERLDESYEFDTVLLGFYVNDVTAPLGAAPRVPRTNSGVKRLGYVLKRSALLSFLWQIYQGSVAPADSRAREQHILTGESDPLVAQGWLQVETSLAAMKRALDERGRRFAIVVLPRRDQVTGQETASAYNDRVAAIGTALGIPVFDALPALRTAFERHGDELFIPWDGHHSGTANAVIAEELARAWPSLSR